MSQLITEFIEKQTKINDKNVINKIYDFLIDNVIVDINDTIILDYNLIYKKIKIPTDFDEEHECHYPITEYSKHLYIGDYDILIVLGIDWFGIRKCGDEYCYYIFLSCE